MNSLKETDGVLAPTLHRVPGEKSMWPSMTQNSELRDRQEAFGAAAKAIGQWVCGGGRVEIIASS